MSNEPIRETIVRNSAPAPASPHHAPVRSADQARAGIELGRMRWVLRISIVLAVVAFLVVWAISR